MPPDGGPVLGIDTTGAYCAVSLRRFPGDCVTAVEEMARGQGERLMTVIDGILAEQGLTINEVSRIGVCTGPGNFTGIRIGVAAARGLALSLGIPAVGVSAFTAVAATVDLEVPFWVAFDAPRNLVYAQRFDVVPDQPVLIAGDSLIGSEIPVIAGDIVAVATRVAALAEIAAKADKTAVAPAPLYIRQPDAEPSKTPPTPVLNDP